MVTCSLLSSVSAALTTDVGSSQRPRRWQDSFKELFGKDSLPEGFEKVRDMRASGVPAGGKRRGVTVATVGCSEDLPLYDA